MCRWIIALMYVLPLVAGSVGAAESIEPLVPQSTEGIHYLSGGVGDEELAQIEAAKSSYNVKILLAERVGSYVSGVHLTLSSLLGEKLVDIPSAGPFVLLQVPAGTYQIDVSYEGHAQQRRLTLRAEQRQSLVIAW